MFARTEGRAGVELDGQGSSRYISVEVRPVQEIATDPEWRELGQILGQPIPGWHKVDLRFRRLDIGLAGRRRQTLGDRPIVRLGIGEALYRPTGTVLVFKGCLLYTSDAADE